MEKVMVSACLLGTRVRYDGDDAAVWHPVLQRWADEGRLVAVCPEVAGGLTTPRAPAEIRRTDGGPGGVTRVVVVTRDGCDVTDEFEHGARVAADVAAQERIRVAILKDGSPSCGAASVHDGTFTGTRVAGEGVTAAALRALGVRVFTEQEVDAAAAWVAHLEAGA